MTGNKNNRYGLPVLDDEIGEDRSGELGARSAASARALKNPLDSLNVEKDIHNHMSPQKAMNSTTSNDFLGRFKGDQGEDVPSSLMESRASYQSFQVLDVTKLSSYHESDFSEVTSEAQTIRDDPMIVKEIEASKG